MNGRDAMRLALLGMSHETNTFSRVRATYDRFSFYRGQDIVRQFGESHTTNAGFLEIGARPDVDVVPLMFASTGPIGTISSDAFERIVGELLQLLRDNGPWDGVLLSLHGAAVSEEHPDADGEITARVRDLVGPDIPVGMTLDLHANVTQKMIANTTVATFYRSNPHLDPRPRALECGEMIVRTIRGEIRPIQALETPPVVINIVKQFTGEEPMASVIRDCETSIQRPEILTASVAEGYPYSDVEEMGMSFLAVSDGDETAARGAARWMARRAWDMREQFVVDTPPPDEALRQAMAEDGGPVVLMDVGDNIGGGSSADSTVLLAAAQRLGIGSFLQSLYDPEAVARCVSSGIGSEISLDIGGKTDDMHGSPVRVTGGVRAITDGLYEDPNPIHGGWRYYDGGTTAVLETTDGHTLLLTSERSGNTTREQMYSAGIMPERYKIVVAKGVVSPRPAYQPIASSIILVNSPGVTTSDLSFFTYHRRRAPLYPFEEDAAY
jgi:microcystin degradation protein MlrC